MLIGLLVISEYVFLYPYIIGHIPQGTELGFVLIVILSILSALVIPMNIYRINIFSTFGSVGATALSFLTNFELPIRVGAIGLLAFTYYTTVKSLKIECSII